MKQPGFLPVAIQKLISPALEKPQAAGSPTLLLDVQLWLAHVCGLTRTQLLARPEHKPSPSQVTQFQQGIARLAAGEPLPYLIGYTEFYSLRFRVTPATLIPRPETEHLVEAALELARSHPNPIIADVGAGSGCMAVTLAVHRPAAKLYAIDISSAALAVAQENANSHQVADRVAFLHGHLLDPLPGRAHLIAANLPYGADGEWDDLPTSVREFEPAGALRGGPAGLDLIAELLTQAPSKLQAGGAILLEIGASQGPAVLELARAHFPTAEVQLQQDYGGRDRLVIIQIK